MYPPRRIVCLTEETVETLYLIGEDERIVGISGYCVRPPQARREKPRVSAFINANFDKIQGLDPDLVLAFSDLQADIAAELARRGLNVHLFNQRTIAGILAMIRMLGAMIGTPEKTEALARELEANLAQAREAAARLPRRPRVYFEEWDGPLISAIGWVSELVEIAGGIPLFADRAGGQAARERFVTPEEVIAARPDMIIGSWCGKKFSAQKVREREGFDAIPAVRDNQLHEVKSALILQPGPAALTDGLAALQASIHAWAWGSPGPTGP